MKKTLLAVAAAALVVFGTASCKKEKKPTENTKPTISWEANSGFGRQEITTTMDAKIEFKVPEGIQSLTLKFTKIPNDLLGVVKQHINTSENRTGVNADTPVLDAIDDSNASSYLSGLRMFSVSGLRGATETTADFKILIDDLLKNQELANNSEISILVSLVDKADNKLTKTVTFHYTSGPEITWKTNPGFAAVELNTKEKPGVSLTVNAPGTIEKAVIYVSSNSKNLVNTLNKYVSEQTATGVSLDLVDDPKVVERLSAVYNINTGDNLKGKSSAVIDLSNLAEAMKDDVSDAGNSDHNFDVTVTDANGKAKTVKVVFHYTPN